MVFGISKHDFWILWEIPDRHRCSEKFMIFFSYINDWHTDLNWIALEKWLQPVYDLNSMTVSFPTEFNSVSILSEAKYDVKPIMRKIYIPQST